MKFKFSALVRAAAFLALTSAAVQAGVILDIESSLNGNDPTQLGRLSRNALPQTWSGDEAFPGVINTGSSYYYHAYSVNVGSTPYIQINVDSLSANTFVSAYSGAYSSLAQGTNWLGDAGSSGNSFGTDPLYFQVIVPINGDLIILVNQTGAGSVGLGDAFHIIVEGFIDTEFSEPSVGAVPEPPAAMLGGGGLLALLLARSRRQKAASGL